MLCVDILAVPHIRKVRSTALLEASNRGKETTPQKIRQLVKVTAPMSNIAKSECHDVKHCTQALMERHNQERDDTARFQQRAEPRPRSLLSRSYTRIRKRNRRSYAAGLYTGNMLMCMLLVFAGCITQSSEKKSMVTSPLHIGTSRLG